MMSKYYNKDKLKNQLTLENIYDLVEYFGGEPEYSQKGLICATICHNYPGEGSRKLYYYENNKLFHCYSGCAENSSFDIFELIIKAISIQREEQWELYNAMHFIASFFSFEGESFDDNKEVLNNEEIFDRHFFNKKSNYYINNNIIKYYNLDILSKFNYPRIIPWEKDGINSKVYKENYIGFYPAGEQITIPHFDINNNLIGIRGRYLAQDLAKQYGKYRPLLVGQTLYNHPLSLNLYHLNKSKDNIKIAKTAIIFESEKAVLQYGTIYGEENNIAVACCGSNISNQQIQLLLDLNVQEIIIAFDRDYESFNDEVFKQFKHKCLKINNQYKNYVNISFIIDKKFILDKKDSPIDKGQNIFEILLKQRSKI